MWSYSSCAKTPRQQCWLRHKRKLGKESFHWNICQLLIVGLKVEIYLILNFLSCQPELPCISRRFMKIALRHWWKSLREKGHTRFLLLITPSGHNHPSLIPPTPGYWYIFYLYWPIADLILNSEDEAKVEYNNVRIIYSLLNRKKLTLQNGDHICFIAIPTVFTRAAYGGSES